MSVNATKAIPTAAGMSVLRSSNETSGTPNAGQARGDGADHRDVVGEAQRGDHRRRADDREEDARDPRRDPAQAEDQRERRGADGERGRVGLVEARDEVAQRRDEVLRVDREAEELGQLRDDDRHGDAHEVAEAHRHRQQLGHEAEARQPAGEHDRADEDREQAGERDPLPTRRRPPPAG